MGLPLQMTWKLYLVHNTVACMPIIINILPRVVVGLALAPINFPCPIQDGGFYLEHPLWNSLEAGKLSKGLSSSTWTDSCIVLIWAGSILYFTSGSLMFGYEKALSVAPELWNSLPKKTNQALTLVVFRWQLYYIDSFCQHLAAFNLFIFNCLIIKKKVFLSDVIFNEVF